MNSSNCGERLTNNSTGHDEEDWQEVLPRRSRKPAREQRRENFEQFILLLVGIPGSGKSTFANKLESGNSSKFVSINQDKLKTRKKCLNVCLRALQEGKVPVIDRCNFDQDQRQYFLDIALNANIPVDCIVFDYTKEECLRRCIERIGHPNINKQNARGVISLMTKNFEVPLHNETYRNLTTVTSYEEADNVALKYYRKELSFF